ncbi:hypothetical protein ACFWDN_21415 [Micromonospora chalcea]
MPLQSNPAQPAPADLSAQQQAIRDAAEAVLKVLGDAVPSNVAHWAVEGARTAMRELAHNAPSIRTRDAEYADIPHADA